MDVVVFSLVANGDLVFGGKLFRLELNLDSWNFIIEIDIANNEGRSNLMRFLFVLEDQKIPRATRKWDLVKRGELRKNLLLVLFQMQK